MPDEEPIYEVADLFKVFGDSTRARIICALSIFRTVCLRSVGAAGHVSVCGISSVAHPETGSHCQKIAAAEELSTTRWTMNTSKHCLMWHLTTLWKIKKRMPFIWHPLFLLHGANGFAWAAMRKSALSHMSVNLCGIQVIMSQNLLQRPDIHAVLQHQRGRSMPQLMGRILTAIQSSLTEVFFTSR